MQLFPLVISFESLVVMKLEDGLRLRNDAVNLLVLFMVRNWLQIAFRHVLQNCRAEETAKNFERPKRCNVNRSYEMRNAVSFF